MNIIEGIIHISDDPPMAPVIPMTVDKSLKKIATVIQERTIITVTSANFQYAIDQTIIL